MRENTKELLIAVVILAFVILFYAALLRTSTKTGVLYMIGDEKPVCSGTLTTYRNPYGGTNEKFTCAAGREINRLSNFYLKEE